MNIPVTQHPLWPAIEAHAAYLNAFDTPDPSAKPFFENLSGALMWSDERHAFVTNDMTGACRMFFAYRTRVMLANAEPEHEFWKACERLFPKWIGFLPERRRPTPELLSVYRRGDVSLRWCLRRLDREMDEENDALGPTYTSPE